MYDYLIVGAGLTGATLARRLTDAGRSCLVIDKRDHIGGNCYTQTRDGIVVHMYGPHYFHTNSDRVWSWITQFGTWKTFVARVKARVGDQLYSFPVNLMTLQQLWGVKNPAQARRALEDRRLDVPGNDAESYLLRNVGRDLYEMFFKGYTAKQWGTPASSLPSSIVSRIPIRESFDDSYHIAKYAALPEKGYTPVIAQLLEGAKVELSTGYKRALHRFARKVIYTGPIDGLYDHCWGALRYRSLGFEHQRLAVDDFQGACQVNYPAFETPFTRIVEHKHLHGGPQGITWITREYPRAQGDPYYPVGTAGDNTLARRYRARAEADNILVCGRLGLYKYMDMDGAIASALSLADRIL